jgi:transforming growth factor-beta-induced protein
MKKLMMLVAAFALVVSPVMAADTAVAEKSIVETAVGAGKFNTLVAALKAAGLVEAVSGKGPLTVFAPTDEAFAKLPKGTVETLLKPENKEKLVAILKYHVVAGSYPAAKVLQNDTLTTLQGGKVTITNSDKGVMIDKAKVAKADIMCTNGVIHVIDAVILPAE